MRITITAADIESGVCALAAGEDPCTNCPAARAVSRALRKPVQVTNSAVWAGDEQYPLPDAARAFVREANRGRTVRPMRFELGVGS